MARIISTNLNSAPEIRLGDQSLKAAPSLKPVQGKDWTESKSPRFDSFRLVTQVPFVSFTLIQKLLFCTYVSDKYYSCIYKFS